MNDLIKRYEMLYSGVIYDALRLEIGYEAPFVLDRQIHKLSGQQWPMVGRAVTARGRLYREPNPEIAISPCAMFEQISEGDVLVIDTMGDDVVAHFGDVSASLAKQAGAVGCVIDGYTRDSDQLAAMWFSLFGRGVTPQDTMGTWGIEATGVPLCLRGTAGPVSVHPGDLIFGDGDGVLVIPASQIDAVSNIAVKQMFVERNMVESIRAGMAPADVFKEFGKW